MRFARTARGSTHLLLVMEAVELEKAAASVMMAPKHHTDGCNTAPPVSDCARRELSGLLSASFMVRCRKNWRGALQKAVWTGFALSLMLVVLYHISVQTLRLATFTFPLLPSNEERIDLNLRVWHTWFDGLGDYAICGLGLAAVHVLCFWLTHGLLGLLERTRPAWAERYRIPSGLIGNRGSSSGAGGADSRAVRRVLGNQAVALVFALLVSPVLRYRVGPWNAVPLPSFGRVQCSILFFALAAESTTYYLHRLLHTPWFWRTVHAQHHSYCTGRSFSGVAALDMHFVEFLALKLVPVVSGPLFMPTIPNLLHVRTPVKMYCICVRTCLCLSLCVLLHVYV